MLRVGDLVERINEANGDIPEGTQAKISEINEQEGCKYCSFKNTDTNTINTSGDNFVLIKNENEITLATDDKYFRTLKISYCPICGKKLLK